MTRKPGTYSLPGLEPLTCPKMSNRTMGENMDGNVIRVAVGPAFNRPTGSLIKEIEIAWDKATAKRIPHG